MHGLRPAFGLSFFVICLSAIPGSAVRAQEVASHADWPQWRGPTWDAISVESGLAESWSESGPPVLWTKEIGKGYSSFVSVGDRVWTQTQTLYEQAVVCLDAATGETIWSQRYGWPYDGGGLYPGPRATPTWQDDRIYYAAPEGTIGCLDARTGRSIWETNPKQSYHGRGTDFGCAASPVVIDGLVIVPVGGLDASVIALDAKNGSLVWRSGESPASYASVLPITLNGRPRVVALLENSLAIIDRANGRLLWEDEFSNGYDEHSAAPLYREPFLMIAGPFRSGAKCYRLVEDASTIKPVTRWETQKLSNDIASSVLVDGYVYGFDLKDVQSRMNRPSRGEFRCLDFQTGQVIWSTDRIGHANIIVADDKLVLFNDEGELILCRASPERYEELARTTVFQDEICWSAAALCHGRLFLRTQTRAACLYLGAEPLAPKIETKSITDIPHARSFNPAPLLGGEREYPATTPEWSELRGWWLWSLAGLLFASGCAMVTYLILRSLVGCRMGTLARPLIVEVRPIESKEANELVSESRTGRSAHPPAESSRHVPLAPRVVFWMITILVGAVGSPLLNHRQREYVFLWPLVLWAALQLTLLAVAWAESQPAPQRRKARWGSRFAGLGLIATSGLYFHLCRRLGLSIEWGFLAGFLPAFPVAALAARGLMARWRLFLLTDLLFAAASFTAYFWSCGWFLKWWLQVGS
jgi:outer membrane protein assembly factor BamB